MKKNHNRETVAQWPIKVNVTVVGEPGKHEVEFVTEFPNGHAFGCKSRHGSVALDSNLDAIRWWLVLLRDFSWQPPDFSGVFEEVPAHVDADSRRKSQGRTVELEKQLGIPSGCPGNGCDFPKENEA